VISLLTRILVAAVLTACPALAAAAAAPPRRPNTVLIVSCDQGYADLGCISGNQVKTPHLDRLAHDGVRGHKNDYKEISDIHYCTLVGMIEGSGAENNGYSTMEVRADGTITLTGFRKQKGYEWMGR